MISYTYASIHITRQPNQNPATAPDFLFVLQQYAHLWPPLRRREKNLGKLGDERRGHVSDRAGRVCAHNLQQQALHALLGERQKRKPVWGGRDGGARG